MSDRRVGAVLSLLRQGLELDVEFGTRSLESLLRIAEIVEESVYRPGSLRATPRGFAFTLANPPLRLGAFGSLRLLVDRQPVAGTAVRIRHPGEPAWRTADSIGPETPLSMVPGQPTEFEVDRAPPPRGELSVRLELRSVAIPPLVWFEFRERVAEPEHGL